jgi:signal transduction histidine kinase
LIQVVGHVRQMQDDEDAIRASFDLAMGVREQHIHAGHTIVAGDESHVGHYTEWVHQVRDRAEKLRSRVPEEQQARLARLLKNSEAAHLIVLEEVIPALRAGDLERARSTQPRIDELASIAAADADRVTQAIEARMAHAHTSTTHVTYLACGIASVGIVGLVALAGWFTRRLRAAVLRPMGSLVEAANRIGTGDLTAPVLTKVDGEFGVVANAFQHMARELRQHEQRLVQHERMAAVGQLAAGVAHEINNPIGVIRGYLRTMIPDAPSPELREELRILDEEAAACQRIAEDLVLFARSPDIATAPTQISDFLRDVGHRFRTSGESRDREIRLDVEPAVLDVDPVRARQVIQNLLRNAVEASPRDSLIEVKGELRGDAYVVRVLDRGQGIPTEIKARLFEPFQSGRPNGTGLGLAVCNGIIRAHGGTIEALTRPGGGTEFVIRMPVRPERKEQLSA